MEVSLTKRNKERQKRSYRREKKKNDFFMEKHVNLDGWASRFGSTVISASG
jgi:hypothetical protein